MVVSFLDNNIFSNVTRKIQYYYFFTFKPVFKFLIFKYHDDVNDILLLVTINIFMNVYF